MKKLLAMLLVVGCFILTACGGPTPKEEIVKLDKEYAQQAISINKAVSDDMDKFWKENGHDWTTDAKLGNLIDQKYTPQIDDLVNKFNSVKVENASVKDLVAKKLKAEQEKVHVFAAMKKTKGMSKSEYNDFSKELMFNWCQAINQDLEYQNEYSLLVSNKGTYELTLANFNKIHKGDTYLKVANTFKMPGKLKNSMESNHAFIGNRLLEVYEWENDGGYVKIMFENGKVYQLEQRNLK